MEWGSRARLSLYTERVRLARIAIERNAEWWLIGIVAFAIVVICWRDTLWPPTPKPHCWILNFQNGDHARVCGDSLSIVPDPQIPGYFIATAWRGDQVASEANWVARATLER